MSAHGGETLQRRCHPSCFQSAAPHPFFLPLFKQITDLPQASYSPGFFPLPSSGETSSPLEGAIVASPLPLACDFRRLRFSRNASFNRSWRGLFLGFFAGVPVWRSSLSFSSFIVNLLE